MLTTARTALVVSATLLVTPLTLDGAQAERVQLQGTYTKGQIKTACSNAGGEYIESGSTYGCENPKKQTSVYCNPDQGCFGYVPRMASGASKPRTLGQMLKGL
jgi:hypothetical protein